MLGVFLDTDTVDRDDLDLSRLRATLPDWRFSNATGTSDIAAELRDAQVAITNKVMLDALVLHAASQLKLICVAATGTNNVDLHTAAARGITVCNVRAYATPSVVEHVFALILALRRRLLEYRDAVRAGRWQHSKGFCLLDYPVHELHGQTLGIIGYGELGQAVAKVAAAFGMQVLIAQRPDAAAGAARIPLPDLLRRADVVSIHCPLTEQTRGLLGAAEFALMKPGAVLINTARGGIIDEAALAAALAAGRPGAAGIDVLSQEPPRGGSPLLDLQLPNLLVTPHTAWAGQEARQRLVDEMASNVSAFLRGEPRNVVSGPGTANEYPARYK